MRPDLDTCTHACTLVARTFDSSSYTSHLRFPVSLNLSFILFECTPQWTLV